MANSAPFVCFFFFFFLFLNFKLAAFFVLSCFLDFFTRLQLNEFTLALKRCSLVAVSEPKQRPLRRYGFC